MMRVFIDEQWRARVIQAAGGPQKISKWLNNVVLPAVFNPPPDVEQLKAHNRQLEHDVAWLEGQVKGLTFALDAAIPRMVGLNESSHNEQQRNPYPPVNGDGSSIPSTR